MFQASNLVGNTLLSPNFKKIEGFIKNVPNNQANDLGL